MVIKKCKSFENEGNDCWIKRSFTLVEDMGTMYLIYHYSVSGWSETDEMNTYMISDMDSLKSIISNICYPEELEELLKEWDLFE